jgi:hypothetical protein
VRRVTRIVALSVVSLVTATGLAGCAGSSAPSASAPVTSPSTSSASLASPLLKPAGCRAGLLPAHFVADHAHTGPLTAKTYSASADVQAALEYDQLKTGIRNVFTRRAHGTVNGVVSCVALRFASAKLATRFFGSYRELRNKAGSIVRRIPTASVSGAHGTVAYFERQQAFRGYHITSTNVVEIAGVAGDTLTIASVAGGSPSVPLARTLLESMVS